MASLDIDSLFINVPLDENGNEKPPNISRHYFRNLLFFEIIFMFNYKYYKQVDGVAMISPLGSALANICECSFESR